MNPSFFVSLLAWKYHKIYTINNINIENYGFYLSSSFISTLVLLSRIYGYRMFWCTGVGSTGQQVTVSIFLTTHIKVTTSLDQHPNKQTPYFRCGGCFGKGHAVGQLSADRLLGGENSKLHNISHNNNSKKSLHST